MYFCAYERFFVDFAKRKRICSVFLLHTFLKYEPFLSADNQLFIKTLKHIKKAAVNFCKTQKFCVALYPQIE